MGWEARQMAEKASVLVVDDEPDLCWALENILSSAGYRVTRATTGQQAMERSRETFFALALIDAKLPDVDGTELVLQLKAVNPGMVVIMISGYFYKEDRVIEEGLLNGTYAGFIAKPFDLSEVRRVAEQALNVFRET